MDTKTLKPMGDRVLALPAKKDTQSQGGIVIPDSVSGDTTIRAEVLAIGDGMIMDSGERSVMQVKVGDTILFAKSSGTEIKLGNEDFVVISESEIMAVVEE
jgi:chaperonin GroES